MPPVPPMSVCPELSLIIPCYNERAILRESLREVRATLGAAGVRHEIILVDDASRDGTPELIGELVAGAAGGGGRGESTLRSILHEVNRGRGGCVMDGFAAARGEIVGFIDVDLETHCRHIPAMLEAIRSGADGAIARRVPRVTARTLYRHVLSRGYNRLVRAVLGLPYLDTEAGFKFFRRDRLAGVSPLVRSTRWFWDTEILAVSHAAGLVIEEVACPFVRRRDHPSSVRPVRDSAAYLAALLAFRARAGRAGAWRLPRPEAAARRESPGAAPRRATPQGRPADQGVV